MRVVIAAQVKLYREGLAEAFERDGRWEVVASAASSREALDVTTEVTSDVVLVEHSLPDAAGLVRQLSERSVKVVVLGVEEVKEEILPLIEDGMCGYVTRDGSISDLFAAVESAGRGETLCSPRMVAGMMERLAALTRERRISKGVGLLTSREREIASLIDEGLSNLDIARRLDIELPTVKNHVHNILDKLQVHRRGEAVARLRDGSMVPVGRRGD